MNKGMTLYDRHEEAYYVCKAHGEEDCEICFPAEEVDRHCTGCGYEIDDAEPIQTPKGLMCRECYTEFLEDENKHLKRTLAYVMDFIKQEATVIEAAISDFAAAPRDPETIGRMIGKTQVEVAVMKGYPERMAV